MRKNMCCISLILILALMLTMNVQMSSAVFALSEPAISVNMSLESDTYNYKVGQTGKLNYTITPTGAVQEITRGPVDTVLVLDRSGSMSFALGSNTRMKALQDAANAFVNHMAQNGVTGDKLTLISFSDTSSTPVSYTFSNSSSYDGLKTSITALSPNGGTNYDDALEKANTYMASGTTNKNVIFFSDGIPTARNTQVLLPKSAYMNQEYYLPQNVVITINSGNKNYRTVKYPVVAYNSSDKMWHSYTKTEYESYDRYYKTWNVYNYGYNSNHNLIEQPETTGNYYSYATKTSAFTLPKSDWTYQTTGYTYDGDGNQSSAAELSAARDEAQKLNIKGVKLHTVSLGTAQEPIMAELSSYSGGQTFGSSTANQLADQFKRLAVDMTDKTIKGVTITGSIPTGVSIDLSSLPSDYRGTLTNSTFTILTPDFIFPKDRTTPPPTSFSIPFITTGEGSNKSIGSGEMRYIDVDEHSGSKVIEPATINIFKVDPPVLTPSTTLSTNQNVTVKIDFPGTTTARYYKVVPSGVNESNINYISSISNSVTVTATENNTTVYAYSVNGSFDTRPAQSYRVTNIDRTAPPIPTFTSTLSEDSQSATVAIAFPNPDSDILKREYKKGTSGAYQEYTSSINVTENDTTIFARSTDKAGNISPEGSILVNNLITVVPLTEISIQSLTNKNYIPVIQNGKFILQVKFTNNSTASAKLVLSMPEASSLFMNSELSSTANATAVINGNQVTKIFDVVKNSNGTVEINSREKLAAGKYAIKLSFKIKNATIGKYNVGIQGSSSPLIIEVVKNPPIK